MMTSWMRGSDMGTPSEVAEVPPGVRAVVRHVCGQRLIPHHRLRGAHRLGENCDGSRTWVSKICSKQKLQVQQEVVAAVRVEEQRTLTEHEQLVAALEPKLKALVLEVFAELAAAGVQPVDVFTDTRGWDRTGVLAYALGRLDSGYRGAYGQVVIDSEGRMAYKHILIGTGTPVTSIHGTVPLDDAYSRVLASVHDGEVQKNGLHLNDTGEIIMTIQYTDWDDSTEYRQLALTEFLAQLAAETAAKA